MKINQKKKTPLAPSMWRGKGCLIGEVWLLPLGMFALPKSMFAQEHVCYSADLPGQLVGPGAEVAFDECGYAFEDLVCIQAPDYSFGRCSGEKCHIEGYGQYNDPDTDQVHEHAVFGRAASFDDADICGHLVGHGYCDY